MILNEGGSGGNENAACRVLSQDDGDVCFFTGGCFILGRPVTNHAAEGFSNFS